MTTPVFFTIVSRNYLAYALTLLQSVAQQYPSAKRYLCLADSRADDPALDTDLFETVTIDQLGLPDFDAFVFRYDIMELNTAVKPYMFAWLRARHPDVGLIYLDPDILVLRQLARVEQAFAAGALLVLTPHLNAPIDDDKFPDELSIMRSGVYNCGFVAINAAHPRAGELMAWWARKLEFDCFVDLERGLFTDQKWMDLAPGMYPDVAILRDDGYNVAYWNLAQRPVTQDADGGYLAGGTPAVFVHFSGVVAHEPRTFSKHQNRFTVASIGGLRPLYERYLALLRENGHAAHAKKPYAYGCFSDGESIAKTLRRAYHRYFDVDCEHPVSHPRSMDRGLFNQPCPDLTATPGLPVSCVMHEVWRSREDLREAFSLRGSAGRERYIRWYLAAAAAEMHLDPRYVEPIRAAFRAGLAEPAASQTPPPPPRLQERAAGSVVRGFAWGRRHGGLARMYARIPLRWRVALRRRVHAAAGVPMPPVPAPATMSRARAKVRVAPAMAAAGVNLLGYARGEFGVAENVRSYARALEASGYPFSLFNFDVGVASRQQDHSMDRHFSEALPHADNVFFINADQMQVAHNTLGERAFAGRHNIGFWVWELEKFPADWRGAFDLVDEVWVPTAYVRDAISAATGKPVLRMPKAIEFDAPAGMGREHFGLSPHEFVFLFSYDFNSFSSRKNPEAAIAAFRRAFADGSAGVRLLVKSINGERFPDAFAALVASVADDPRIEVRDGFLSRDEMFGLQNTIDCYVSLHRAEGFGLGMAECMYLGKPVVATGYSGNMDFMDKDNSLLVDYKLIPVRDGEYPYWQGQHWADADVAHAATLMRQVFDDRALARRVGASAAASIRRSNSKAACAAAVIARLRDIDTMRSAP